MDLERYGSQLTGEELGEFDAMKDDYEISWHLKHLRSLLSPTSEEVRSRSVMVKNRGRAYLDRLICDGQYFSEDAMPECHGCVKGKQLEVAVKDGHESQMAVGDNAHDLNDCCWDYDRHWTGNHDLGSKIHQMEHGGGEASRTSYREDTNSEGKTPRALFTEQHKDLVKEGEKWMKEIATACMVVAALISTIMFAAAFTVPGGYNNDTGIPIFLPRTSFMVFIISLLSSSTSVLMFLGILTSRYGEEDFLKSLPGRMMIGLVTLFLSVVTMMVAFGAALFIVLRERLSWVAIPVTLLATIPIIPFAILQFPLFVDMITFTYGSGAFNQKTRRLY
ncbi:hypothetical protein HHK36_030502 [Tetracentron sinense]|uniref:PGG domain-containing protein n=1 Tax=Tetracentron sinense TaxID=13715 RepID=A0A834Y9Z1_TETSI|nr:hypothetical protein HHK36_030502 [Tetracentron sinense]